MIDDIMLDAEEKMGRAVEYTKEEFSAVRTGRAHPGMFAKLTADYYGAPTPIEQLASFQVPEARMILITPFDRAAMPGIEKAIRDSDLGVNPTDDGNVIRVTIPELTEERRKEYIRMVRNKAEEARVSVRGARRSAKDAIEKMVKDSEVSEDEGNRSEKQLDQLTKSNTDSIDDLLQHKEAELLEV